MPEIVEIGNSLQPSVMMDYDSALACPQCHAPYQLSFDRQYICLTCHPQRQIYAMLLSLKQQLNNETQMRMYSGSSKAFDDYKHNIIEPQLEQFAEQILAMRQTIAAQNKVIIELNKKVKILETKARRTKSAANPTASPNP